MPGLVESSPDCRERYVVFLDLLGFKTLVEAAERHETHRDRLREVLDGLSQTLCNNPHLGMRFTYFSDCIIISAEPTAEALWEIFHSITTLTCNLLQFDVFVRGGITRGGTLHSGQYVYGTAVNRAAVIEKDEAKAPLTLLSPEVHKDAMALGPHFLQWLETDGADRYFVHFLMQYTEYHKTPAVPGKVVLTTDAERIAFHISRRLLTDTGNVLSKAQWFQAYWNRVVARPNGFQQIEADASSEEPAGPATVIRRRLLSS